MAEFAVGFGIVGVLTAQSTITFSGAHTSSMLLSFPNLTNPHAGGGPFQQFGAMTQNGTALAVTCGMSIVGGFSINDNRWLNAQSISLASGASTATGTNGNAAIFFPPFFVISCTFSNSAAESATATVFWGGLAKP